MKKLINFLAFILLFTLLNSANIFTAIPDFFSNLFGKNQKKTHDSWLLHEDSVTGRSSRIKWQNFPALNNVPQNQTIVDIVLEDMMEAITPELPLLETLNYSIYFLADRHK